MELQRLELLVGKENVEKIKQQKVLIIGLGGVGGYVLESLARSGIETLIIIDNDMVDITNLNRQVITLQSNIGKNKVDVAKKRVVDINKNCNVVAKNIFVTEENISEIINDIDYVVDACDTISTKKAIIRECIKKKIKFISCMGTGNKMHPSLLQISDIRKTSYDPIAKIIRKMVKDENIKEAIPVVYSKEIPIKNNTNIIGSNSFVPATAGLLMTSYVINDIVGEINAKNRK